MLKDNSLKEAITMNFKTQKFNDKRTMLIFACSIMSDIGNILKEMRKKTDFGLGKKQYMIQLTSIGKKLLKRFTNQMI